MKEQVVCRVSLSPASRIAAVCGDCALVLVDAAIMANYSRKSFVSGDHLESTSGVSWTVLWDTAARADGQ